MLHPPYKKASKTLKWASHRRFQILHAGRYIFGYFVNLISRIFKLHPLTMERIKRSFELGNPYSSVWPSETIPMVSHILSGGFWNFSFFQFNRGFYFPFWAHRQYNPREASFIPRSHNILSINQTNRNWASISFPGKEFEVSIDPAGAVMPWLDSFTVEFAVIGKSNKGKTKLLRPHDDFDNLKIDISKLSQAEISYGEVILTVTAEKNGVRIRGKGKTPLIMSLRPFNMEGPVFLKKIGYNPANHKILGDVDIQLSQQPLQYYICDLQSGDALKKMSRSLDEIFDVAAQEKNLKKRNKKFQAEKTVKDEKGVITAAFLFAEANQVDWFIDDHRNNRLNPGVWSTLSENDSQNAGLIWRHWFEKLPQAQLPKPFSDIFQHMTNHLLTLWDYNSITPGSFTYHHFWIRDAVVMLDAHLTIGGHKGVRKILERFNTMVDRKGFFKSQAGEWDANGQALWIIGRYVAVTGDFSLLQELKDTIVKLCRWLEKTVEKYSGVLPPGFSAEHLGIADWYLWDNFWAMGGLKIMSRFSSYFPQSDFNKIYQRIHLALTEYVKGYKYYPAALGRRKDAGMIGSISAVYPLKLNDYFNQKMFNTANIIHKDYFYEHGGFFQENIHSGINPYLTLELAESFLILGENQKAFEIFSDLMAYANKGYTFPEAVHPQTKGGCMGDGFHGWAFAESILFLRNMHILEMPKTEEDVYILLFGIPDNWFDQECRLMSLTTEVGVLDFQYSRRKIKISGLNAIDKKIFIALPEKYSVISALQQGLIKKPENPNIFIQDSKNKRIFEITTASKEINIINENKTQTRKPRK